MSATTAELNRTGSKRLVLAELRRRLAPGASLALLGDGWTLRHRTGRQDVFTDVESLILALDGSSGWAGPDTPQEVLHFVLKRAAV